MATNKKITEKATENIFFSIAYNVYDYANNDTQKKQLK